MEMLRKVSKGEALQKGERIAWLKEEMEEGKTQYSYVEMLVMIHKYINRFQEELAAIRAEDKHRKRCVSV